MKNICLLDLNYTLVGNQADTRLLFAPSPAVWPRRSTALI